MHVIQFCYLTTITYTCTYTNNWMKDFKMNTHYIVIWKNKNRNVDQNTKKIFSHWQNKILIKICTVPCKEKIDAFARWENWKRKCVYLVGNIIKANNSFGLSWEFNLENTLLIWLFNRHEDFLLEGNT